VIPHLLLTLTTAACLTAFAAEQQQNVTQRQEARVLAQLDRVDPALAVAWNQRINDIGFAEESSFPKAIRAHVMMHVAMHDALNAVIPLYRQYAYHSHDPGADPIAAAAQAAHDVAVSQYPGQQAVLDAELAKWLSRIPETPHKTRGIAVGRQSAATIIAARVNDGWDYQGTYTFSNEPGAYQTTPPWNGFVLQPGFSYAKPFGLRSPDQFRPGPPPRLDSPEYAVAFNEVKDFGRIDSTVRTPDQTLYAVWWLEFGNFSEPSCETTRDTAEDAPLASIPHVRAAQHEFVRRLYRQPGFQIRVQSLASVHGHQAGGSRRQPGDSGRPELGATPNHSTVSGIRVRPRYRNGGHHGHPGAHVWRQRVVHDGNHDRASGNADAFVPQLQSSRGGVRGFARTRGISFPLRHRPRPDPGPCGCRLAGRELPRVWKRVAERLAITEAAGLEM
jgi:hypothetical protein